MSSTVPPAAKSDEAFEPDNWDIPDLLPEAGAPASRGPAPAPPRAPIPGLPLQRPRTPGAASAPTSSSTSSSKQPESTQRAAESGKVESGKAESGKVVQPPPLPRQRRTSASPGVPVSSPTGAPSEPRKTQPTPSKEWSRLDPGAGAKPPSVERPAPRSEKLDPSERVERPEAAAPPREAKAPAAVARRAPLPSAVREPVVTKAPSSNTERPQATAVPPPARHPGLEQAMPVARPLPQSPTLMMPALAPPVQEAQAEAKAVDAPKPPSQPRVEAPLPRPPAQEAKLETPQPRPLEPAKAKSEPALPTEAQAPPALAAKTSAPAPEAKKAPALEAKTSPPAPEPKKPAPALEAKTVEPPAFEPKPTTLAPPEDAGWLGPIIEPGASLDDIERREASVLLDFDSDLLPSTYEQERAAPGQHGGASICTFWLGQDCFGLDVQLVSEVLMIDDILPVPWAPPALLGLFNSRGRIVPVVELSSLLGLESGARGPRALGHASPAILIKADSLVAAAVVDRPGLVVQVPRGAMTPTERGSAEPWVKGHLRLDERSHPAVTLLDSESLVQRFLDMSRFPDIRTCLGSGGYRPARATSAKHSEGNIP